MTERIRDTRITTDATMKGPRESEDRTSFFCLGMRECEMNLCLTRHIARPHNQLLTSAVSHKEVREERLVE
jgi:hypothetical protein